MEEKPVRKKTNGKRNRAVGHELERRVAEQLRPLFPHIVTSRAESKSRDDQKVDLMNKDERKNGKLPYNIQAKSVAGTVPYVKLLAEMPDERLDGVINLIVHQKTERRGATGRFFEKGVYAVLAFEDLLHLIKQAEGYKELEIHWDSFPKELQEKLNVKLETLGL